MYGKGYKLIFIKLYSIQSKLTIPNVFILHYGLIRVLLSYHFSSLPTVSMKLITVNFG